MSAMSRRRGFTLLEMMVASTISLIVLAGALWSAAELQRRGLMEESLMDAQNALRIVREMIESELQRAGSGMGSARLVFGTKSSVMDTRYVIAVGTNDLFDGKGLFPKDATFKAPDSTGPYADRVSDAVQMWSWDTEAPTGTTPSTAESIIPLVACEKDPIYEKSTRAINNLCVNLSLADLTDRVVMVVKPSTRMACVMTVKAVDTTSYPYTVVTVVPGFPGDTSAATGPCEDGTSPPSTDYYPYWAFKQSDPLYIIPLRGVAFRVNWMSGGPVLERQELTSVTAATGAPWVALSEDVEMMKLRLGVMEDLNNPLSNVLWFPDPTSSPVRKAIDACIGTVCDILVPVQAASADGGADAGVADDGGNNWTTQGWTLGSNPTETDSRDALMRRMRMVELRVTTRTTRADQTLVKMTGPTTYALDADGNPRDGYRRRTSTLQVLPRNFDYAGVSP